MFLPGGIIGGAPRLAAEITHIDDLQTLGSSSYTLSGLSWGAEVKKPNRRWIIATAIIGGTTNISGSQTINGASASVIFNSLTAVVSSLQYRCVAFAVEVPSGASGVVTLTLAATDDVRIEVYRAINLDLSAASDSDIDAGTGAASLAIDCPANGWILAGGRYAYSSGSTPTSADFANLDTLSFVDSNQGGTGAASGFSTAQTALNVTYDPTPNTNITRSHAFALSFARTY